MLYHFSEDPGIEIFRPRAAKAFPHVGNVVWAIDEERSPHYYFPRDCPRVIYWRAEWTTKEDSERFFGTTAADKVIIVENGWLDRIRSVKLYRYTLPDETFTFFDKTAGYYISPQSVIPERMEKAGDLLKEIIDRQIEYRFSPDLHPIRSSVITSTLDYSIIRFGNAIPKP